MCLRGCLLGPVRVACGLVLLVIAWRWQVWSGDWYGSGTELALGRLLARSPTAATSRLLEVWLVPHPAALGLLLGVCVPLAGVMLVLGWHTRLAAVVACALGIGAFLASGADGAESWPALALVLATALIAALPTGAQGRGMLPTAAAALLAVCLALALIDAALLPPPAPAGAGIASTGRAYYLADCARCHGLDGRWTAGHLESLVGTRFQQRDPSVQVILDVVRSGGERDLRAMRDQDILAAARYVAQLNGGPLAAPIPAAERTGPQAPLVPHAGLIWPPPSDLQPLALRADGNLGVPVILRTSDGLAARVDQVAAYRGVLSVGGQPRSGDFLLVVVGLTVERGSARPGPGDFQLAVDGVQLQALAPAGPLEGLSPWPITPAYGNAGLLAWKLPQTWSAAVLTSHGVHLFSLASH